MIVRDIGAASRRDFDLLVIGGGIYGASLLREAASRGLSVCLCEAADFGGGTSWNSLRIVHGGLRYLQTMNLRRFFQSVAARRQVARQFPTLVRPLRCLMPLYGSGLKRVSVMRMALAANDVLSASRNEGLAEAVHLPAGAILDGAAMRRAFPQVRKDGLEGAASWSDYFMVSSERILIELIRDACRRGAMALNYAPVGELLCEDGQVGGVRVRDAVTGQAHELRGRAVIDCTGPQVRGFARDLGARAERLFCPSLAFNLLLNLQLPTGHALAVAAPRPGAPILFLVPQQGSLLAGTIHLPRPVEATEATPTDSEIEGFLELLNEAVPGLGARPGHVQRVFAGLLPAAIPGSSQLRKREILEDHGAAGGIRGFYSVSGVKFTTAADVAGQMLAMIRPDCRPAEGSVEMQLASATEVLTDIRRLPDLDDASLASVLQRIVEEESVLRVDDLVMRRTNWAVTQGDLGPVFERLGRILPLPWAMERGVTCG